MSIDLETRGGIITVEEAGTEEGDADTLNFQNGATVTIANKVAAIDLSGVGVLKTVLADGKVLADDGNVYDTVQEAENNATDWVLVGPATFNENVTVDTAGLTIQGFGRGSHISGDGSSPAIDVQAANVTIRDLSVTGGTAGGGDTLTGIVATSGNGGDSITVKNVWIRDTDNIGIDFRAGNDHLVSGCVIEAADDNAIRTGVARVTIEGCRIETNVSLDAIVILGADCIISDCVINGAGSEGINLGAGSSGSTVSSCRIISPGGNGITISSGEGEIIVKGCVISGATGDGINDGGDDNIINSNRITGAGDDGIVISGTDQIVSDNRVSGSTTDDIDDSAATTPVVTDNITGAAN